MSDQIDDDSAVVAGDDAIEDTPHVTCSRCGQEWSLEYELETLCAGNGAVEQFALDHQRHTGHYPDAVRPWIARCRRCSARETFLAERPARRWASTHARHTEHTVGLSHGDADTELVDAPDIS